MLQVENLGKQYKGNDFYSLRGVNFSIQTGEVVGLIGKNGSGKTTLLKMLGKAQRPSEGKILYKGEDIFHTDNQLDEFGLMIEPVFYEYLTVMDNLKFYLQLHQKEQFTSNIEAILQLVDLWHVRNRKPHSFSFGMKQRLSLAISLVAEPKFMILDEPFVGLDPVGVNHLIRILKKWVEDRQMALIISSHQLSELETICTRFMYLENGSLKESFDKSYNKQMILKLKKAADIEALSTRFADIHISADGYEVCLKEHENNLDEILSFITNNYGIENISTRQTSLTSYFNDKE